ncbi:MAG: CRISPR-associated protein Cas4 [Methanobacterium sp.]|uniref:CRISPR-associated protein Cas4 n=1 Tax=Methanobacterium sp. TaxID=2164 RepID=UPI003D661CB7|nr:CRISPR-associated protein Cas4 [Methanobacterium sp.]
MLSDSEKELRIIGTQINYYFICKTKLWLFSHHIQMEQESELVSLGKLLHQKSYKDEKEYTIDNLISVDFIKKRDCLELHEVKKSNKMEKSHEYQLLYYMYYLKDKKGIENIKGIINYPKMRKKVTIDLDESKEMELMDIIKDIGNVINNEAPKPVKMKICKKCAYYEFCWI